MCQHLLLQLLVTLCQHLSPTAVGTALLPVVRLSRTLQPYLSLSLALAHPLSLARSPSLSLLPHAVELEAPGDATFCLAGLKRCFSYS